jgi:shikimate dehydrogenase
MVPPRTLVGLIGANIQKSLSPLLHEDAFAAAGIRGHYHLMDLDRLPGRTLAGLLAAARTAGFAGVNVTYPCKEAVLPLLDTVSAEALEIGAVNTVVFGADGRAAGHNTDRIGFRRGVEDELGADCVKGAAVALIGAGGAGRAVAFALADLGAARVAIHDVDGARAARLAADLAARFGPGRATADPLDRALAGAAGIVNATPVGMAGFPGMPVPESALAGAAWVADVVYTPLETAFLAAARARRKRVATGGGMCVHQAAEAFRLFSGWAQALSRGSLVFAAATAARDRA